MNFSSTRTSPNGSAFTSPKTPKSTRPKPILSLTYSLPNSEQSSNLSVTAASHQPNRPLSPALIPIPSPIFDGFGNQMQWKTVSSEYNLAMPKAPHLSRSKDAFSPLPLTPGGMENFGPGGLFEALQKQYLESQNSQVALEQTSTSC